MHYVFSNSHAFRCSLGHISKHHHHSNCSLFFAVVAFLFYLYFLVFGISHSCFGLCYRLVAMVKSSELVKGHKLKDYMLNFFFILLSCVFVRAYLKISSHRMPSISTVYGLLLEMFASSVNILQLVAYSLLYFHCEKATQGKR